MKHKDLAWHIHLWEYNTTHDYCYKATHLTVDYMDVIRSEISSLGSHALIVTGR